MIPPIFIYALLHIPYQVLGLAAYSASISGEPGKPYYCFSFPNSERHFSILSAPALTIRARFAVIRLLTRFVIVLLEIKIPRFISDVNIQFFDTRVKSFSITYVTGYKGS